MPARRFLMGGGFETNENVYCGEWVGSRGTLISVRISIRKKKLDSDSR